MVYLRAAMLLLVLLCCVSPVAAQPVPPSPRQVTVFDGLPSNTVNRMAEDRYGYLWIATNDGLAPGDGLLEFFGEAGVEQDRVESVFLVLEGTRSTGRDVRWSVNLDRRAVLCEPRDDRLGRVCQAPTKISHH